MTVRARLLPALVLAVLAPGGLAVPAAGAVPAEVIGGPGLAGHGTVVGPGADPLPDVAAAAFVVADATTGEVLAARAAHVAHRPASTLKTLTAITLMPRLDPAAEHTVTPEEMAPVYGSRAGIVAGATYTIDDLWHALLLPSGNDAAAALAGAYGGRRKTVAAMNREAHRLRARDTHAVNPSGLDADGQVTSAYDLALFARAALAMPEFVRVSGTTSYDLPGAEPKPGKKRATFRIYGQNRMLNDGYKGVIAGKTGYTTLAGRTFWVAATRGGHTVIVTLLGIGEATETAASRLMTWGLHNAGRAAAVGTLVDPAPEPAPGDGTSAPPATSTDGGAGAGTTARASAAGAVAGTSAPHPALLVLLLAGVLAAGVLLLRRRRRSMPAAPAPVSPATSPTPPALTSAAAPPTVAPTGNVTVVSPPRREP